MYTVLDPPILLPIGNQGEINTNHIKFNIGPWQTDYPIGAGGIAVIPGVSDGLYISYTRSGETSVYPEPAEQLALAGDVLTWTPSATVLAVSGEGTMVIHCMEGGDEKTRSHDGDTYCAKSPHCARSTAATIRLHQNVGQCGRSCIPHRQFA